jgi:hypothetical protein
MAKRAEKKQKREASVLLDSGAFSAWNKGEEINLNDYIAFVKAHEHLVDNYVCLDTIPGSMGRMDRSQDSIENSAKASYKNQQIMRDAGLSPIPVFHQGERFEWLEKYVSDGEPYVGISPYMRSTQTNLMKWLDECFSRITDAHGRALVKTHGFGVTSHEVMWRYPWHSVDSTTWAIAPAYGMLVTPAMGPTGELDVRLPAKQFHVGNGELLSAQSEGSRARCLDGLGAQALDWLHKYAEICGTSVTAFRNDQYSRTTSHIVYLKLLEAQRGEIRFAHKRATFFKGGDAGGKAKAPADVKFRVIFATNLTNKQCLILTRLGAGNRLLSYADLRKYKKDVTPRLEQYVINGHLSGALEGRIENDVGGDISFIEPAVRVNWEAMHYKDFRRRRLAARFMQKDGTDEGEPEAAT